MIHFPITAHAHVRLTQTGMSAHCVEQQVHDRCRDLVMTDRSVDRVLQGDKPGELIDDLLSRVATGEPVVLDDQVQTRSLSPLPGRRCRCPCLSVIVLFPGRETRSKLTDSAAMTSGKDAMKTGVGNPRRLCRQ